MAASPDSEFSRRLKDVQEAVERALEQCLPADPAVPDRLTAAMRHAVMGGGKRFRPFMVVETARLFGADADDALRVGTALELVHCYSLVHDDLPSMDNDVLRRGRPTVWRAFDEWTAILAGDALLTLAFEIVADRLAAPPAVRMALLRDLARASGAAGMVGGQVLDLEADKLGRPPVPSPGHVQRLQAMKTGALIRCACMAGALLADRPADVGAMARFGEHLGFAFQIADDLLDATGDAAVVGKAVGKDAAAGKATLVALLGLEAARRQLAAAVDAADAVLDAYGPAAATLRGAVRFVADRRA